MLKTLFITICLLLLSESASLSQSTDLKHAQGDSTLKEEIAPRLRALYELEGQRVFLLTKENLHDQEGAFATELQGTYVEEHFSRIVATTWVDNGKYSVEYYWEGNELLFTYETFEYFEEASPPASWRNFKGLASWERRTYYDEQKAGYIISKGNIPPNAPKAKRLLKYSTQIHAALEKQAN